MWRQRGGLKPNKFESLTVASGSQVLDSSCIRASSSVWPSKGASMAETNWPNGVEVKAEAAEGNFEAFDWGPGR